MALFRLGLPVGRILLTDRSIGLRTATGVIIVIAKAEEIYRSGCALEGYRVVRRMYARAEEVKSETSKRPKSKVQSPNREEGRTTNHEPRVTKKLYGQTNPTQRNLLECMV